VQELATFVCAVESGSFTAAARVIGSTPSAVSKGIAQLEQRLGVRLFHRSTRTVALTNEGRAYYDSIAPHLRALKEAGERLREDRATGRLRVSLPRDFGVALLEGITRDLMGQHPSLSLDVSLSDRHVDLIREGFDLAVRIGEVADTGLIVRRLGTLTLVLAASPGYLAKRGSPTCRTELRHHDHVRYRLGGALFPIKFADGVMMDLEGHFDSDSGEALRIAALSGLGVVQILRSTVERDLRSGRLVEVLADESLSPVPVQVLHAFGQTMPVRARVFVQHIAAQLAEWDLERQTVGPMPT
jgi:DNA-binding transcriptional LysR family regulator